MLAAAPRRHHSYAEYLALDEASNVRLEFYAGDIYAMAGGSPEHAALCVQLAAALDLQLTGKPGRVYSSDLRVRALATGLTTYADVTVVCGPLERDPENQNTIVNPTVLVEVLSPSGESYDRGEKREHYQQIASVREIVLVSQTERSIEVHRRQPGGWSHHQAGAGESIALASIDCRLDVDALYDRAGA
jgi:Uma2 family endonuclease